MGYLDNAGLAHFWENIKGKLSAVIGLSMAGQQVQPTQGTTVTAGTGAEIFNDYRERAFNSSGAATAGNVASGQYSHAEGMRTTASAAQSHAEGGTTIASGIGAHAEGSGAIASNSGSHAEGSNTTASGYYSHAEGSNTIAAEIDAHSEGRETIAYSAYSKTNGFGTIAEYSCETAIGRFNVQRLETPSSTGYGDLFVIGKGSKTARANIFRVNHSAVYGTGTYNTSGADYAELFEWADGNPDAQDRTGRFVTLAGEKLRFAGPEDGYILGIVSGSPSVLGDVYDDQWAGMFLTDVYGRPVMEDVEVPAVVEDLPDPEDPEKTTPREVIPAHTERRQKLNPAYDNSQRYIPRTERPEWAAVGLVGKLVALDDGSCRADGWCAVGEDGVASASAERTRFRCMARLDESHVRIMILP